MGLVLLVKSRKMALLFLLAVLAIPLALSYMPQTWFERMETIQTYQDDRSVQGRFDAWEYAYDKALNRPLIGGGFQVFAGHMDAHSIYFEVLGEHGFIGLGLFLLLIIFTWRSGSSIKQQVSGKENLYWSADLASMVQASLVGYAASGAFLGLAYFDLYYHLVAIMVLTKVVVVNELAKIGQKTESLSAEEVNISRNYEGNN